MKKYKSHERHKSKKYALNKKIEAGRKNRFFIKYLSLSTMPGMELSHFNR